MNYVNDGRDFKSCANDETLLEATKIDAYNYIHDKCKCCSVKRVCCDKLKTRCTEKAKMSMSW